MLTADEARRRLRFAIATGVAGLLLAMAMLAIVVYHLTHDIEELERLGVPAFQFQMVARCILVFGLQTGACALLRKAEKLSRLEP